MKVILAGSRNFPEKVFEWVMLQAPRVITEVVSGMARGPDTFALAFAAQRGLPVVKFPADWSTYGKAAGHLRNAKMAEYADALTAFWDGTSKGTYHMIHTMSKLNKPYVLVDTFGVVRHSSHPEVWK